MASATESPRFSWQLDPSELDQTHYPAIRLHESPVKKSSRERIAVPDDIARRFYVSPSLSGTERPYNQQLETVPQEDEEKYQAPPPLCIRTSPIPERGRMENHNRNFSPMSDKGESPRKGTNALGLFTENNSPLQSSPASKKIKCLPMVDQKLEQCQSPVQTAHTTPPRHHQAKSSLHKILPPLPEHHETSEAGFGPVAPPDTDAAADIAVVHSHNANGRQETKIPIVPQIDTTGKSIYQSSPQIGISSASTSSPTTIFTSSTATHPSTLSPIALSSEETLRHHHRGLYSHREPHQQQQRHTHKYQASSTSSSSSLLPPPLPPPPPPPIPVSVYQPGQISRPQLRNYNKSAAPSQSWRNRLCGFSCSSLDELITRVLSLLCPCVVYGRTKHRLDQRRSRKDPTNVLGHKSVNRSCVTYGLSCSTGLCCIPTFLHRTRIRRAYHLTGSVTRDVFLSCCCAPCAVAQHDLEMCSHQAANRVNDNTNYSSYDNAYYGNSEGLGWWQHLPVSRSGTDRGRTGINVTIINNNNYVSSSGAAGAGAYNPADSSPSSTTATTNTIATAAAAGGAAGVVRNAGIAGPAVHGNGRGYAEYGATGSAGGTGGFAYEGAFAPPPLRARS